MTGRWPGGNDWNGRGRRDCSYTFLPCGRPSAVQRLRQRYEEVEPRTGYPKGSSLPLSLPLAKISQARTDRIIRAQQANQRPPWTMWTVFFGWYSAGGFFPCCVIGYGGENAITTRWVGDRHGFPPPRGVPPLAVCCWTRLFLVWDTVRLHPSIGDITSVLGA